jgi:hypothetical protein
MQAFGGGGECLFGPNSFVVRLETVLHVDKHVLWIIPREPSGLGLEAA